MCYDFVYPDIKNVLRFLDNHDTDRFLRSEPKDLDGYKQGVAFLLTIPGTPQLYYGHELLMSGTKKSPGWGWEYTFRCSRRVAWRFSELVYEGRTFRPTE